MDDFREIFRAFLSTQKHTHAPTEVMAALEILKDELSELEPEDQELLLQAQNEVANCPICNNSLRALDFHTTPHIAVL